MTTVSLIKALASTTSRIEKEQLLIEAFMTGEREFFKGAQLAYDILITFGVKKVAEIEPQEGDDATGTLSYDDFLVLAAKLRSRELTGHAARDTIHDYAEQSDVEKWNYFYRRILLKDLKCGVDTSTINKILNKLAPTNDEARELLIPDFSCQLAQDGAKPEHEKKVSGKKMLDIKLDGVRLLTVLDKEEGTVTQYTRNGKVNENFTEIREGLEKLMATLPGSVVLDGEVVSSNFQDLMRQVNRRSNVNTAEAKLAVFDIIPLAAFRAGICHTPQHERHTILSHLETSGALADATEGSVYVIPKVSVDLDTPEGQKTFREFNKAAIEAGYEGIMVKDPFAPYVLKRTFAWLKIKPFIEVSLTVVGIEEGKADSKYVGMLGTLVCKGNDDGKEIEVKVGGGISDEQRALWWKNPSLVMGFIAEVRADATTQSEDGKANDIWSLRFPRLKGFRGTVPGEKL